MRMNVFSIGGMIQYKIRVQKAMKLAALRGDEKHRDRLAIELKLVKSMLKEYMDERSTFFHDPHQSRED